jgi:hypothetical protein
VRAFEQLFVDALMKSEQFHHFALIAIFSFICLTFQIPLSQFTLLKKRLCGQFRVFILNFNIVTPIIVINIRILVLVLHAVFEKNRIG